MKKHNRKSAILAQSRQGKQVNRFKHDSSNKEHSSLINQKDSHGKKTICLNMIVKNESHIIEETLNSIYKFIDYYVINDTGSTDDTIDKIKTFFDGKNIKGEIIEHEFRSCKCHSGKYKKWNWFHFGWNRTFAIQQCLGKSDYILIIDADDIIIGDFAFPTIMDKDSYSLKLSQNDNTFVYTRLQIIKNDKKFQWHYVGGIHEYLTCGAKNIAPSNATLEGNYYMQSRRLGDRSKDDEKYKKDALIFEDLLKDEPTNRRNMFYCAQSHFDAKDFESAIKWYTLRSKKGGFMEEAFYSLYRIGLCKIILNHSKEDVINAFLHSHRYYPKRVEPLFEIIAYLRKRDDFAEGYNYANQALKIPYPSGDVLFIHKDIYDYKLFDEVALCAFYSNKVEVAHSLWEKVLLEKKYPESEQERLESNYNAAKKYLEKGDEKPILCFYVGYTDTFDPKKNNLKGCDKAVKKLAELLKQTYKVYIFGTNIIANVHNEVHYENAQNLQNFSSGNNVHVMIICRYIHYFLHYRIQSYKTYLWIYDQIIQPVWNEKELPCCGKFLLHNVMHNLDGIITLSEWHKSIVTKILNIDSNRVCVIEDAIDLKDYCDNNTNIIFKQQKIKNRFIYNSASSKGLKKLVEHFVQIKKQLPDAELYAYDDNQKEAKEAKDFVKTQNAEGIVFKDCITNKDFASADFWYYPTNYSDPYCTDALEAQLFGCMCITTKMASLLNIVEDRGVLLDNIHLDSYLTEALKHVTTLSRDDELKQSFVKKAKEWALTQTWQNVYEKWKKLLN